MISCLWQPCWHQKKVNFRSTFNDYFLQAFLKCVYFMSYCTDRHKLTDTHRQHHTVHLHLLVANDKRYHSSSSLTLFLLFYRNFLLFSWHVQFSLFRENCSLTFSTRQHRTLVILIKTKLYLLIYKLYLFIYFFFAQWCQMW